MLLKRKITRLITMRSQPKYFKVVVIFVVVVVDRFRIPQICEFYGSTEGNCSVGNFSNKLSLGFCKI